MRIPSLRTIRTAAIVTAGLLVLYAAAGFWLAPGIVRSNVVEALTRLTGRSVTLEDVSINPFALSATFRGFSILDRDSQPVASFRELYVNYEVISLLTGEQTFSRIAITDPLMRVLVRSDGSVNVQDLVPAPDPSGPPGPAPQDSALSGDGPTVVVIEDLAVVNGDLEYEDRNRTTPFTSSLDSLSLSLKDFTTRPNEEGAYAFTATTMKGEGITWKGDVMVRPIRSRGSLALTGFKAGTIWEFMQDRVHWKVIRGTVDLSSDYEVDLSREPLVFRLTNGSGTWRDVTVVDTRDSTDAVLLPEASVSGVTADMTARSIRIDKIAATNGSARAVFLPDSSLSIQTLFLPKSDARETPDTSSPWRIVLDEVSLSAFSVPVEDRRIDPPATFEVVPLNVSLKNYRYGVTATARLSVEASINRAGRIAVSGPYVPEPLSTTLSVAVDTLPLTPFQPYVASSADLEVKAGTISVKGTLNYRAAGSASHSAFSGDVGIRRFRAIDTFTGLDFLRLPALDLRQIRYASDPPSLSIRSIAGRGVYARLIVDTVGLTNVQRVLRRLPDSTHAEGGTAEQAASPAGPQTRTRIDEITIADGVMDFSDLSLTPNFIIGIHDLNGSVRGLSSDELARADVNLEGRVDRYAPAVIRGQINPLTTEAYTDISFKFDGIELTTFAPYAGKFMGYLIDKGKMNLALHYRLNNQYLKGDNKVVLDQLTLGQKVEGPSVTDLPVKLAIALLKDSRGVIDLDIPVEGDLNDPEFSLFPIILKVIVNLFVKLVTAPFALIGALFGGGEELSFVEFAAGSDSLEVSEQAKLDSVSRALRERPELTVNIRGVSGVPDREFLARQQVFEELRGPGASPDTLLSARDREKLFALYRKLFGEDPVAGHQAATAGEGAGADPIDAAAVAALKRVTDQTRVPDEVLRALAQRRAARIKDRFVLRGGVADARLFLQDVSLSGPASGSRVKLELALDAK